jgi:hypothetical protein
MAMQAVVFKTKDQALTLSLLGKVMPVIRSLHPNFDKSRISYEPNSIIVDIPLFQEDDKSDAEQSVHALLWLLEVLAQVNQAYLAEHPETPSLYDSGIRYVPEEGTEEWQDIPTNIERGSGDCEDLAAHITAEMRNKGTPAKPYLRWQIRKGSYRMHALSQFPDGSIEDPSLKLGMADYADYLART